MTWFRRWFATAYILATLVASGAHDHGRKADDEARKARGDCHEQSRHVDAQDIGDHESSPVTCPSCQFRADHSTWRMASTPGPLPSVALSANFGVPSAPLGAPLRARCRAPPRDLS